MGNEGKTKYRVRVCAGDRKRLGEEREGVMFTAAAGCDIHGAVL